MLFMHANINNPQTMEKEKTMEQVGAFARKIEWLGQAAVRVRPLFAAG